MKLGRLSLGVPLVFLLVPLLLSRPTAAPRHQPWSEPVNLGAPINSSYNETAPTLTKDGRSLYFSSNRPCGEGDAVLDLNIWVARRSSKFKHSDRDAPWGPPECLALNVDGYEDSAAAFSRDGHWMFFVSDRPGSMTRDIWVSWRRHVRDDDGWGEPVRGVGINSNAADAGPAYFKGDKRGWPQLFFASDRSGTFDIWVCDIFGDGQFGVPRRVTELSTDLQVEARPSIRRDGLELFFFRGVAMTPFDIYASTRRDPGKSWSEPVNLGPPINTAANEQQPGISSDGRKLFFASNRPSGLGNLDIWVSTRAERTKHPDDR